MKWKVGDKFKYENALFQIYDLDETDKGYMAALELDRVGSITVFGPDWRNRIKSLNSTIIKEKLGVK